MKVRIVASNQFGNLETSDLESFERSIGTTLPEGYRNHLLEHNGGYVDGSVEIGELGVAFGIHGAHAWQFPNLGELYSAGFPREFLPIAEDQGGNYVCIGLSGSCRGGVFFWHHECGPNIADGFTQLSPDFDSYLRGVAIKVALSRKQTELIRSTTNEVGVNAPVYAGKTILDMAFEFSELPIIEMLVSMGGKIRPDALIEAVRNNQLDMIQFLLKRDVDVNYAIPETGFTALMLAGSRQLPQVMGLLVAHGADPTLRNRWGKSADDLAAGNWQGEFV